MTRVDTGRQHPTGDFAGVNSAAVYYGYRFASCGSDSAWRMRRAFTIVELLVVVAIVALLISVLLPALGKARAQARSSVCAANLRQMSSGLQEYLQRSRDRYPHVSFMPSIGSAPLTSSKPIFLANVLKEHVGAAESFHCPDDQPGGDRPEPNVGKSYFQSEKSSYQYKDEFRVFLGGRKIDEVANIIQQFRGGDAVSTNMIWIMRDYTDFHKRASVNRKRNYLYNDGHVADYEEF